MPTSTEWAEMVARVRRAEDAMRRDRERWEVEAAMSHALTILHASATGDCVSEDTLNLARTMIRLGNESLKTVPQGDEAPKSST